MRRSLGSPIGKVAEQHGFLPLVAAFLDMGLGDHGGCDLFDCGENSTIVAAAARQFAPETLALTRVGR